MNSKLKPIDHATLFKFKEHSDALESSKDSITVSKSKNKASTESSTSVKNTSHEGSGKITAVNEP